MRGIGWARVNHDVAGVWRAHGVAVGAWPCHHAGVGRGEALHVAQQRNWRVVLPLEFMHYLTMRRDQGQLTKRLLVLHMASFFAVEQPRARAAGKQGLLAVTGLQQLRHVVKGLQFV